ncbi:hypothetical protein HMPREF9413_4108 [Paenibacillus sp. HGF7]|nr:hypothetical protein HMPREF9413_4108 [Paenibacillus sp. HGF7]
MFKRRKREKPELKFMEHITVFKLKRLNLLGNASWKGFIQRR